MSEHSIEGGGSGPVNTLLTVLTSVNRDWCTKATRETRVVGFRVPSLAQLLYSTVLTQQDKETLRLLVEGLIYSIAKERLGTVPCEAETARRINTAASIVTGKGTVVFNVNINAARAEANPTIKINIKQADVEYLERLLRDLVTLLETHLDARAVRVLRARVARAERILEEIRKGVVN